MKGHYGHYRLTTAGVKLMASLPPAVAYDGPLAVGLSHAQRAAGQWASPWGKPELFLN